MYAIFAYIGGVLGVNVGIYSIHGVYGLEERFEVLFFHVVGSIRTRFGAHAMWMALINPCYVSAPSECKLLEPPRKKCTLVVGLCQRLKPHQIYTYLVPMVDMLRGILHLSRLSTQIFSGVCDKKLQKLISLADWICKG